ncbi:hypothetical protein FRC08_002255 [Ceratobasidium sp. 394]|nr:hypothetical protein FRC08_002255 [Ceratobasidium sp. 394]
MARVRLSSGCQCCAFHARQLCVTGPRPNLNLCPPPRSYNCLESLVFDKSVMAAVIAPTPTPLRRRALRAGTTLLAAGALDLVNVPAANGLAQQAQGWLASLRPHILQAPENNDQNAREQATRAEQYAQLVETTGNIIGELGAAHQDENVSAFLLRLQQFHEYLNKAHAELQNLQTQHGLVKFACQADIKNCLDEKQDEILSQTILFCLENGLLANRATAQSQENITNLRRHVEEIQHGSDERIRHLEHQVSVLYLTRRTDGQCGAGCIAPGSLVFFLD